MVQPEPAINTPDPRVVEKRVQASLQRVESYLARLSRSQSALVITGTFTSGTTALLTGWTSAAGPLTGDGIDAWRMTCIVAAVLAFISTIVMGLSQQLRLNDRLSQANQCAGRLKSLEFALALGTKAPQDAANEYTAILKEFPEALR